MKLFCRQYGEGQPVVIMHGLFGASDNWVTIAKELAQNRHILVVDMRNHGRSPHNTAFSYSDMVEDIYELLTDFGIRESTLIGHSMGGLTAMNFALEYPHRVNKLVVIDIAPKRYPVLHRKIFDGLLLINLAALRSRKEADTILSAYVDDPGIRQFLLKNLYRNENNRYAWRLNLDVISRNISAIGDGIFTAGKNYEKDALFLRGEYSDYISSKDKKVITNLFPNAQIKTIAGASHWVHSDAPAELLQQLQKFL